jgi:hypothetical protein
LFSLHGNGNQYGDFHLSQLPIALGPFNIEMEINEMIVSLDEVSDCSEAIELDISCDMTNAVDEFEEKLFKIVNMDNRVIIIPPHSGEYSFSMYNLTGQLVFGAQSNGEYILNKQQFDSGIYILNIVQDKKRSSYKLFIAK